MRAIANDEDAATGTQCVPATSRQDRALLCNAWGQKHPGPQGLS